MTWVFWVVAPVFGGLAIITVGLGLFAAGCFVLSLGLNGVAYTLRRR